MVFRKLRADDLNEIGLDNSGFRTTILLCRRICSWSLYTKLLRLLCPEEEEDLLSTAVILLSSAELVTSKFELSIEDDLLVDTLGCKGGGRTR